jgi:NADP-dependent 3-hydroxy acid dehydrogenase YdfG
MTDHLEGKAVVITGAGGGFGRLVTERLTARAAHVVGVDVDEAGLAATIEQTSEAPGTAVPVPGDVTRLADLQLAVGTAVERFGKVDAIVNNAGVMPLAFFADHAEAAAAWDRCIDINVKGVLNGMIAVHDRMIEQGYGHVVNLSSIYGNFPVAGAGVYGMTKAAVNVLSESFRVESQGRIKVTIVKPTGVPGTGLGEGIVNVGAIVGILGQNAQEYLETMGSLAAGGADAALTDSDDMRYAALAPEHIADAIVFALDQPWGVSIGDITVRATGDRYVL